MQRVNINVLHHDIKIWKRSMVVNSLYTDLHLPWMGNMPYQSGSKLRDEKYRAGQGLHDIIGWYITQLLWVIFRSAQQLWSCPVGNCPIADRFALLCMVWPWPYTLVAVTKTLMVMTFSLLAASKVSPQSTFVVSVITLQWRHNGRDSISNHQTRASVYSAV